MTQIIRSLKANSLQPHAFKTRSLITTVMVALGVFSVVLASPVSFAQQPDSNAVTPAADNVAATGDELPDPPSEAELQQMLAPIALYPDTVLAHILIAATYPLEVVQAHRWLDDNPGVDGEAALAAVEDRDWDPSVKALVPFPEILTRMNEDLDWTQTLGEAFLADESRVMEAVQGLRQQAYDEGNLESLEHLDVRREQETIIIEPTVREVVYIPYYDSRYVYGSWLWHDYPPVYWHYVGVPRIWHHAGIRHHFYWGPRVHVSFGFLFSSFQWHHHRLVVIDHHHHHRHNVYFGYQVARHHSARHWRHNPRHRRGVVYRNPRTRDYFENRKFEKRRFENRKFDNRRYDKPNRRSARVQDSRSDSREYSRSKSSRREWSDNQRQHFSARLRDEKQRANRYNSSRELKRDSRELKGNSRELKRNSREQKGDKRERRINNGELRERDYDRRRTVESNNSQRNWNSRDAGKSSQNQVRSASKAERRRESENGRSGRAIQNNNSARPNRPLTADRRSNAEKVRRQQSGERQRGSARVYGARIMEKPSRSRRDTQSRRDTGSTRSQRTVPSRSSSQKSERRSRSDNGSKTFRSTERSTRR